LSDSGPYHTQNAALGLGALWDAEAEGAQSSGADGDDLSGSDDEDGILAALPTLIPGQAGSFTVTLRNTTGASAYLNAWIDFNNNGNFEEAGEKVMSSQVIANGATSQVVSFTTPAAAKVAIVGLRLRLTQTATMTSVGNGGVGEVEDYRIGIDCPVITVNPPTVAEGHVGFGWTQTYSQTGSLTTPIGWSSTGTLPPGLSLVASTGVLSGTPTTAGVYNFRIIATDGNNCTGFRDYSVTIYRRDWSDWTGFGGVASSDVNGTIKLGANVDNEVSITGTTAANADDTTGTDDEDGVTQTTLRAGQSGTITVNVTNTSGATAYLNVWADWNKNNLADTGEQIATNTAIATGTSNSNIALSVTPPSTTTNGTLPLRARITNVQNPGFSNTFPGTSLGEVEDHLITITAPNLDFGDYSGFAQATSVANTTIKLGVNAADAEVSLTGNTSANVDDTTGTDDEDGVTQTTLRAGQSGTITVNVTNTSGAAAYLNVWADWNKNNLADAGEQIATNTAIATGTSNSNIALSVTPPSATTNGTLPLRARITNVQNPGFSNTFPGTAAGEVEDHLITITAPNLDFGDFSGFAQATSVANTTLRIGTNATDAEASLTGNTSANVDDTTGTDDEDGVTQTTLRAGQSGTVTVRVTNTSGAVGYLNVWADWNQNNLADAGEQIATNTAIATGTSNSNIALSVTPPAATATGTIPLRARITNVANPGFSNTFPGTSLGEVEDHLLTITAPNLDFGDFSGFAQATSVANTTIKLGVNAADAEASLTGTTSANADDTTGTDDEDGVTQTTLRAGQSGTITVNVTNTSGAAAYLNVWADWNQNNVADTGEQLATNTAIATGTSNSNIGLSVTPPIATATGTIPLRARITNIATPGLGNTFPGTSLGEVEDHLITITAPNLDFGDFSGFAQATSVANATIKMGVNAADAEVTLTGNTSANVDDTTVTDDEDGVTQTALRASQSGTITVNVTNTSGAAAYLNVWADWNKNNLADAGEQIATNTAIATGTSNSNIALTVNVPSTVATGTVPLRARITNVTNPGFSNTFPGTSSGEVEDHLLTISGPNQDFGDFSGFAQATSVANATIKLGTNAADAELTLTGNTSANADDTTGTDDEDGVTQTDPDEQAKVERSR
jgi:hypothetical protein